MSGAARLRAGTSAYAVVVVPLVYGASFPSSRWSWLGWIAFVPWFVAIRLVRTRSAVLLCCLSTLLGSYFCTPWLVRAVANYYQQPLALGVALFAFVWVVTISPFLIAFTLCFRALARRPSRWLPLLTAAAWVGAELARARLLVGDPFGLFGYSQVNLTTLVQIADITGVYGMTFLPMAVNAALAEVWLAHTATGQRASRSEAWRGAALVALLVAAAYVYGSVKIASLDHAHPAAETRIAIVQPNLDLGSQWRQEFYGRNLTEYMLLTRQALAAAQIPLVFWSESAMTFFLAERRDYQASLASVLRQPQAQLIAGGVRRFPADDGEDTRYYNSAFAIAPDGRILAVYDKQRLLPFAEYFPFGGIGLLRRQFARVNEFTPGGAAELLPTAAGRAGVLICNEAMFGEIASERVIAGAEYLVNLANDTWLGDAKYGETALDMARLRAVEQRRYLVRASTAGPSAIVDPLGRVVARTAPDTEATLGGSIRAAHGSTVYARSGDAFALVCALLPVGLVVARRLRARRRSHTSATARDGRPSDDDAA